MLPLRELQILLLSFDNFTPAACSHSNANERDEYYEILSAHESLSRCILYLRSIIGVLWRGTEKIDGVLETLTLLRSLVLLFILRNLFFCPEIIVFLIILIDSRVMLIFDLK